MEKTKRLIIILFLLFIALIMDTALFLLKKTRSILFFPGG